MRISCVFQDGEPVLEFALAVGSVIWPASQEPGEVEPFMKVEESK